MYPKIETLMRIEEEILAEMHPGTAVLDYGFTFDFKKKKTLNTIKWCLVLIL